MAAANITWGAPRIHAELLKLGFAISERTRLTFNTEAAQNAMSNMEDLSDEPRRAVGLHRLFHRFRAVFGGDYRKKYCLFPGLRLSRVLFYELNMASKVYCRFRGLLE
jgi:hypothetical protein